MLYYSHTKFSNSFMNESSSSNSSQSALIALVIISLVISLGTMGFLIQQQNRSADIQQELLATLTALRTPPLSSPDIINGQPPQEIPPLNGAPSATNSAGQVPPQSSQNDDWTTVTHDGITISYPKNLSVTTYEDEFVSGQRDLRISSSATRKIGIDSRNFQGYEIILRQIDDRQYSDNRKESTVNPRVSSIVEKCDGETCPSAQYVFIKNGKRYLIEVLYQMNPYQAGIDLNNRIIASIK